MLSLALAACLIATLAGAADDTLPTYVVTSYVVTIQRADIDSMRVVASTDGDRIETPVWSANGTAWPGFVELRTDGGVLSITDNQLTWNGSTELPADEGIEVVSGPRITVQEGLAATMRSGTSLQYLVPRPDGAYDLKTTGPEDSPGMIMEHVVKPPPADAPDPLLRRLEVTLSLTEMTGRESLTGVGLDVGRPTIVKRDLRTTIPVRLGQWNALISRLSPATGGQPPMVLVLLTRVDDLEALKAAAKSRSGAPTEGR
jgi:hypothetical protein